jgi:hypothetical protein
VDTRGIEAARKWLDGFWDEALAAFNEAAELEAAKEGKRCRSGREGQTRTASRRSSRSRRRPRIGSSIRTSTPRSRCRFVAESATRTSVELEHRHLDRYGARREEMRGIFGSEGGWGRLLEAFVREAAT